MSLSIPAFDLGGRKKRDYTTARAETAARQAAALAPRTAWGHCALGLIHFREGDFRQAAEEMEHALELDPSSLWPNFYHGSCAYRLGQFEEASTAFSVCVALAPQCDCGCQPLGRSFQDRPGEGT